MESDFSREIKRPHNATFYSDDVSAGACMHFHKCVSRIHLLLWCCQGNPALKTKQNLRAGWF